MLTNTRPNARLLGSQAQHFFDTAALDANAQRFFHALRLGTVQSRQRLWQIVQMTVGIDKHADYMVWVWRSDCSAPAR